MAVRAQHVILLKQSNDTLLTGWLVGWNTECVLINAMFCLHAPPKKGSTMAQHALTLFQTKIFYCIQRGSSEVHIVFDMPMVFTNHPKSVEHKHTHVGTVLAVHLIHTFNHMIR